MAFTIIKRCCLAIVFAIAAIVAASAVIDTTSAEPSTTRDDGVVRVQSAYGFADTIDRLKGEIAMKGIRFFASIDQAALAGEAGIKLHPSTLLIFGNPPLGTQFVTANANAGLDWPVRLLVTEDAAGKVWAVYTDFQWIARRHGIADRGPQFDMASTVITSITSSVRMR